ncbi:MAG TPA: hypothetical protein VGC66_05910 [Pyrinomonadaceae bacterium]|jgi:hypothetical protein
MKRLTVWIAVATATFIVGSLISARWQRSFDRSVQKNAHVGAVIPGVGVERSLELNRFGRLAANRDLQNGKFKIYSFIYYLDNELRDIYKEIQWRDYGIEQIDIIWSGEMAEYARGYNQVSHPALLRRFGKDFEVKISQKAIDIKLSREEKNLVKSGNRLKSFDRTHR